MNAMTSLGRRRLLMGSAAVLAAPAVIFTPRQSVAQGVDAARR